MAHEDGMVALLEQFVDGDVFPHVGVADELDPELPQVVELSIEHLFLHLEVGDAVEQDSARLRPGVEEGDLVAALRQLLRDGKAGRARADHGRATPARRRQLGHRQPLSQALVVGDERLQLSDRHRRLGVDVVRPDGERDDAVAFAEPLLRAEAAAHIGQVARLAERVRRADDVADL